MFDIQGKTSQTMAVGDGNEESQIDEKIQLQEQNILPEVGGLLHESQYIGSPLGRHHPDNASKDKAKSPRENKYAADLEMIKERFAKLLLGEDMFGGGKGVSSALALSNAIADLPASVFGEQKRLEPMPQKQKCGGGKKLIDFYQ